GRLLVVAHRARLAAVLVAVVRHDEQARHVADRVEPGVIAGERLAVAAAASGAHRLALGSVAAQRVIPARGDVLADRLAVLGVAVRAQLGAAVGCGRAVGQRGDGESGQHEGDGDGGWLHAFDVLRTGPLVPVDATSRSAPTRPASTEARELT